MTLTGVVNIDRRYHLSAICLDVGEEAFWRRGVYSQFLVAELSQTVSGSSHPRHPSSSPQIPFNNLHISDDPRYQTHASSSNSRSMTPTPRPYPQYGQDPRASAHYAHGRSSADPRHGSSSQYPMYGQVPPVSSRQTGPMPSNAYPYSASLPPVSRHPSLPMPNASSTAVQYAQEQERISSGHRYECSYCGKGFTRPSSLKVRCSHACPAAVLTHLG